MRRLTVALLLSLFAFSLHAADLTPAETAANWIADAYGLRGFDQVSSLTYTFNVRLPDKTVSRQWIWEPGDDRVTLVRPDGNVTYQRSRLGTDESRRKIDAQFINDQYWLLFPLHLVWDRDATLTLSPEPEEVPGGEVKARRLTIQYPDQGGYTPGDAYDVFFDQDFTLTHWIYRKGGAVEPTRWSTWERHERFGPLLISLDHQGAGGFRVWFTDVKVETER